MVNARLIGLVNEALRHSNLKISASPRGRLDIRQLDAPICANAEDEPLPNLEARLKSLASRPTA